MSRLRIFAEHNAHSSGDLWRIALLHFPDNFESQHFIKPARPLIVAAIDIHVHNAGYVRGSFACPDCGTENAISAGDFKYANSLLDEFARYFANPFIFSGA
jgi:hypothetical protein